MASPLDAQTLYHEGCYRDALAALQQVEKKRPLVLGESVLLAELLARTGDTDGAIALALRLQKQRDLSSKQHCRLRDVLGSCYFRKADVNKGSDNYRWGIELAERSQDLAEECRLRLQLFANQVHWVGAKLADTSPSELRRKVHQVADPALAVSFQLVLAELAAKSALVSRARKYLETARALLPAARNQAVLAKFNHNEVALLAEEGDFEGALHLALKVSNGSNVADDDLNFTTLVGHLCIAQAKFADAEAWLHRGLSEDRLSGGGKIAHLDTLMLLKLSQSKLEEAGELAASIDYLLDTTSDRDSFFGRWHLITRTKWLLKTGRTDEALALVLDGIKRVTQTADEALLNRLRLLASESYALLGDAENGILVLTEVVRVDPTPSLEGFAERCRVFGFLAATVDKTAANTHFRRASRILRALGNIASALETESSILETSTTTAAPGVSGGVTSPPTKAIGHLVQRLSSILALGDHPPLLGTEVLSLLTDSECVAKATLVRCDDAKEEIVTTIESPMKLSDSLAREFTIELGHYRDSKYLIRVAPLSDPDSYFTSIAVETLAKSAVSVAAFRQTQREQVALWPEQSPEQQLGLVCASERMLELVKTIRRVAGTNITILLTGETGVGKELFARALHQASARRDNVFLPFNCTTVSRDLLDSRLFGHRRGSFTGATEDSPGLIRAAAGGTLFLDEIGEMSLESQPKLLRFLESGEVLPLGQHKPELVDVRVVAATNANLGQLVADGKFREDLYYRLNIVPITIPPLRERREEIPLLVDHFLDRYSRESQKPMPRVADETLEYLVLYRWPGNVRQLSNELRRMVALTEPGAVLMPAHLSAEIAASRKTIPAERHVAAPTEVIARIDQPLAAAIEHLERAAIQRALAVCDGRVDDAAKLLGLSRKGLYLKRQRLKIEDT